MTELSPWLPMGASFFALVLVTVLSSYKAIDSLHSIRLNQASRAASWSLSLLMTLAIWVGITPDTRNLSWTLALGGTFAFGLFAKKCPSEFSFWSKKRARYIYLILFCGCLTTLLFLDVKPSLLLTLQIAMISVLAARNHRRAVNTILADLQMSQSKILTQLARKNQESLKTHSSNSQSNDSVNAILKNADAS